MTTDVRSERPTLLDGWRNTPMWFKPIIGVWSLNHVLGLVIFLTGLSVFGLSVPPPASIADVVIRLILAALSVGMLAALVGTVTDIYATPEGQRTQKIRSLAIGLGLIALCVMFFAATLVRLGSNVFNRAY